MTATRRSREEFLHQVATLADRDVQARHRRNTVKVILVAHAVLRRAEHSALPTPTAKEPPQRGKDGAGVPGPDRALAY
jgi:hypothetical protein